MVYRAKIYLLAVFVLVMAFSIMPNAAQAGISWNISERSDAKIISLNKSLSKKLVKYQHLSQEPMFILMADQTFKIGFRTYRQITNQIYSINDASAIDDGSRRFQVPGQADIKETGAWRQRDGKIERLDDDTWEIIEGDGLIEVFFAPTDLEDGDIIGFSMETEHDWPWFGNYLWLASDIPTMMSRTRIKTHNDLAYHISGYHLPRDGWSKKILTKSHEIPVDLRMTVVDIPARPEGPWTPTETEFLPYLYVSRRGVWNDDIGAWFYNVSWNEVAYREMMLREMLVKDSKKFASWVKQKTRTLKTDTEKIDFLHRFVRDEVVSISSQEVDFTDRSIVNAFNDRQATRYEKGQMLFCLCMAGGIDVDLLVGRSGFLGVIDMGDPTAMQLVSYVVRYNDASPRYYVPQFDDAPAGKLPPRMKGVKVLAIPSSLPSSPDKILNELISKSGGSLAVVWNSYRKRITKVGWAKWENLPGDSRNIAGTCVETVRVDPKKKTGSFSLQVLDGSGLQQELRSDASGVEKLEQYLSFRYPDADYSTLSVEHGIALDDTLLAEATLSGLVLPPSGESEWILPASVVFGEPMLSDWDAHDGDPFIVRGGERRVAVWRVPLPEGWKSIKLGKEFIVQHSRFNYQSIVFQEGSDLVITRTLLLKQGMTMYTDLPKFRETLDMIQAHERTPVLIRKHL